MVSDYYISAVLKKNRWVLLWVLSKKKLQMSNLCTVRAGKLFVSLSVPKVFDIWERNIILAAAGNFAKP